MAKSIEYLREFATGPLLQNVDDPDALEDVRLLRALGWVAAELHPSGSAFIKEVTSAGQAALYKLAGLKAQFERVASRSEYCRLVGRLSGPGPKYQTFREREANSASLLSRRSTTAEITAFAVEPQSPEPFTRFDDKSHGLLP